MEVQSQEPTEKPLIDISSIKNLNSSLIENKDAINEKVDNINIKVLEASKVALEAAYKPLELVMDNADRVIGGAFALAAAGATILSLAAGIEAVFDPQAVRSLFGETPKVFQILASAGSAASFSFMYSIGKNMLRGEKDLLTPKG